MASEDRASEVRPNEDRVGEDLLKEHSVDGVRVIAMARPPVNALNADLMAALSRALRAAEADPAICAVVLTAEGAHFSAGSDISELGRIEGAGLPALCSTVERLAKPVVAAISGNALGGAMELVLAAHARVAHTGARLGLPEVSLGLLPVAGATQRLPRLVGAAVALKLLLEGLPLTAAEALAVGLVEEVVEDPPQKRARALAQALSAQPPRQTAERRDGLRDPMAFQSAINAARQRIANWRLPAPARMVDCVAAAQLLSFDMGLGLEQTHAADMAATPEAQGLRHAFMAERRALMPPAALAGTAPARLGHVVILGTLDPAPETVRAALAAGLKVTLAAADRPALTAALQKIAARQAAMVSDNLLQPAQREADWARLSGVLAADGVEAADLILMAPDAPKLADYVAPVVSLGGRGPIVLHPGAASGTLAELSVAPAAPLAQQALALAFGRRLGWKVLVQGPGAPIDQRLRAALARAIGWLEGQGQDRPGIAAALASYGLGAGLRMKLPPAPKGAEEILGFCLAALINEGGRILEEGAARRPSDIDAAALMSGLFPRWEGGPMYQADRRGLMALRAELRQRAETTPRLFAPAPIFDRLIGEGRHLADLNR